MILQALPWFLFGFALLLLVIELLVSSSNDAKAQLKIAELLQQQRIDQAATVEARTGFHRVSVERDLARATVRDLVDMYRDPGLRPPRAQPLPMPPDVDDALTDDALTEEFTQITGRHVSWPKWPTP